MKSKTMAFALSAALVLSPLLASCGSQGGTDAGGTSQSEAPAAPVLDGKWRQVGHGEDENGMIGSIDEDTIALWIKGDDGDWTYWYGTFEPPKDTSAYEWTSKANKANMKGLLASQDDTKKFSYADGKISFEFSIRGETTTVTMEQVSEEKGLLAELKSGEGAAPEADAQIKDLELADSGYVIDNGYVHYAVAISNPNEKYAPQSVNISVVGRAADGSISFSDDWTVGTTLPGATTYWANQAGNGNAQDSDEVEIKISVDEDKWYQTSEKNDFYQIENVNTSTDNLGYLITTGEITLTRDVKLQGYSKANSPQLVCVLKNADGKIITGFSTYLHSDLKVGEKSAFEIRAMYKAPEFATAEAYANPW